MNVASFVLCACPFVAKTAIATSGAVRMVDIAIRFREFAVEQAEYGRGDRTPSF